MTFNPLAASSAIESFFLINSDNKSALDIGAQTPSINADFIYCVTTSPFNLFVFFNTK